MVPGTAKTPGDRCGDSARVCPPATGGSAAGCRAESTTAARKGAANSPPAATIVRPTAKRTICRTFDMVSTAEKERGAAEMKKRDQTAGNCCRQQEAAVKGPADPCNYALYSTTTAFHQEFSAGRPPAD
jgi:hypothetical protein